VALGVFDRIDDPNTAKVRALLRNWKVEIEQTPPLGHQEDPEATAGTETKRLFLTHYRLILAWL